MKKEKLKPGTELIINIPFTYTIGEEGPVTGNMLETVEDCEAEVMAELDEGNINGSNVMLDTMKTIEEKIGDLRHYSIGVTKPKVWEREGFGKFFAQSYYRSAIEKGGGFELPDGEPEIETIYGDTLEEVVEKALKREKDFK